MKNRTEVPNQVEKDITIQGKVEKKSRIVWKNILQSDEKSKGSPKSRENIFYDKMKICMEIPNCVEKILR